ncbi:hypothetical protein F5Y00DRAFT_202174 [Daldinia vernicosa]|uniref:uncharacterized protein n=1 Tax=Daldinia vernicosa TaxID=114800 RepID=UPI002008C976|nr:uncharacterized protein F5Y00DRAFT_202174 [Daldinia vernicosa]KAI0844314.1 hypothetical protein F5Y00DRAFT_202174 [Daldinia vernicosa]
MGSFEPFEPLMDFNLPELLVGDLEESKEIFKSRQLTAGAPAPSLAGDGSKRRYSLQDSSLSAVHSSIHPSNLLDTTWKAKSLQNVNETQSHFFTVRDRDRDESRRNSSDSDSASSESSGGLMPPSIGTRGASIATTATSVTSEKLEPPNHLKLKLVIQEKKQAGNSWMDLDAEDPTSPNRRYSMINISSPAQYLSLRHDLDESTSMSLNSAVLHPNLTSSPPTSPKVSSKSSPKATPKASPKASPKMSPASVKSSGTGEQRNRVRSPLACPTPPPERRSSLMHRNYPVLPKINVSPSLQALSSQPLPTQREDETSSPDRNMPLLAPLQPSRNKTNDVRNDVSSGRNASKTSLHLPEADIETDEPERHSHAENAEYLEIAAAGIDVESWLESSVDNFPYYAQNRADGHMPLPLPPDVLDTLRISITCFPETMLQCSSLSIETIRGHSRKLRYKSSSPASLYSESPASVDSSDQSKQTKWKWLPLKRQQSSPAETPTSPQRSGFGESLEPRYSPVWPRKPDWTTIQNLFPSGSDYLCDALYAHLVAYNYITSLCPRSVLINPTTTSRPTSKSSTTPSEISLGLSVDLRASVDIRASTDGGAIPRKAATLLGLQDDPNAPIPEPPSSRCNTLRNKRSFFAAPRAVSYYEVSRPTTAVGSFTSRRLPQPDQGEQVLKDLRLGLARCISRLVATLRVTNGSPAGPDGAGQMKQEENPDFMRALCEIVRLSEERYM